MNGNHRVKPNGFGLVQIEISRGLKLLRCSDLATWEEALAMEICRHLEALGHWTVFFGCFLDVLGIFWRGFCERFGIFLVCFCTIPIVVHIFWCAWQLLHIPRCTTGVQIRFSNSGNHLQRISAVDPGAEPSLDRDGCHRQDFSGGAQGLRRRGATTHVETWGVLQIHLAVSSGHGTGDHAWQLWDTDSGTHPDEWPAFSGWNRAIWFDPQGGGCHDAHRHRSDLKWCSLCLLVRPEHQPLLPEPCKCIPVCDEGPQGGPPATIHGPAQKVVTTLESSRWPLASLGPFCQPGEMLLGAALQLARHRGGQCDDGRLDHASICFALIAILVPCCWEVRVMVLLPGLTLGAWEVSDCEASCRTTPRDCFWSRKFGNGEEKDGMVQGLKCNGQASGSLLLPLLNHQWSSSLLMAHLHRPSRCECYPMLPWSKNQPKLIWWIWDLEIGVPSQSWKWKWTTKKRLSNRQQKHSDTVDFCLVIKRGWKIHRLSSMNFPWIAPFTRGFPATFDYRVAWGSDDFPGWKAVPLPLTLARRWRAPGLG